MGHYFRNPPIQLNALAKMRFIAFFLAIKTLLLIKGFSRL
jgi:hypothetical protein